MSKKINIAVFSVLLLFGILLYFYNSRSLSGYWKLEDSLVWDSKSNKLVSIINGNFVEDQETIYYKFEKGGKNCPDSRGYITLTGDIFTEGLCLRIENNTLVPLSNNGSFGKLSFSFKKRKLEIELMGDEPQRGRDSVLSKIILSKTSKREAIKKGGMIE